ncbi:unnamed protein product [Cunninghamella blakesleeana]
MESYQRMETATTQSYCSSALVSATDSTSSNHENTQVTINTTTCSNSCSIQSPHHQQYIDDHSTVISHSTSSNPSNVSSSCSCCEDHSNHNNRESIEICSCQSPHLDHDHQEHLNTMNSSEGSKTDSYASSTPTYHLQKCHDGHHHHQQQQHSDIRKKSNYNSGITINNNHQHLNHHQHKIEEDNLPLGNRYSMNVYYKEDDVTTEIEEGLRKKRKRMKLCGYFSKGMVFCLFFTILLGGIATFFCWPRTPLVIIGSHVERKGDTTWGTTADKRPWVEANWFMNITFDNRDNWIPTHISKIEFTMIDSLTQQSYATATLDSFVLPQQTITTIPNVPFQLHYSARSDSDTTFQNLYRSCSNQPNSDDNGKQALNMNLRVVFHFYGIVWSSIVIASSSYGEFACP